MDKVEYIKSLGWVFEEYWNNRAIYELGKNSDCPYALFEHQGEVGIVNNGDFKYYNLKEEDLKKLTDALNLRETILHSPDDYTVRELFNAYEDLDSILSEFAIRQLNEDSKV